MNAQTILADLLAHGIELECTPDGKSLTVPAGALTPAQRAQVLTHKAELIRLVQESSRLTHQLLLAAMRACDHHGDGPEAREQMRQDCLNTPPHLRADLLDYFRKTYEERNDAIKRD